MSLKRGKTMMELYTLLIAQVFAVVVHPAQIGQRDAKPGDDDRGRGR